MAYDSGHDEVILFGGECDKGPMNDTWTYNSGTNNWINKSPATAPSARQACGIVYDSAHDEVLLFGGWNGSDFLGDTWTYDLNTNIWKQRNPQSSPSARGNCVLAYDNASGVAVLFGGYDRNYLSDTWTYDAGTNAWTDRRPAHAPSTRSDYAMAYDSARRETVLFGGYNSGHFFNETWTYDLAANDWTNRKPAAAPSPRGGVAMAYDTHDQMTVLFGMYDFTYANETWTYDSGTNTWTQRNPASAPSARVYFGMAFDSARDRVVLFGGGRDTVLGDLWTYDCVLDNWAEMHPISGPLPRYWHAMAYDSAHGEIVLFGGYSEGLRLNDTWTYNFTTNRWTDMDPSIAPPRRLAHGMAYDTALSKVVLFGGEGDNDENLNDTWAYDRTTNEWRNMSPPSSPAGRAYFSMAYDSVHGEMVLFGGMNQYDTWTYNLSLNRWTDKKPPTQPDARWGNGMAFDALHQKMIIYGGSSHESLVNDTWAYDLGTNRWKDMNPPDAPSPRGYVSMAYDLGRNEVVLFGGWSGGSIPGNSFGDTWTYDMGTNEWTGWHLVTSPPPRFSQAMVYNDVQEEIVMYGGTSDSIFLGDIWAYDARTSFASGAFTSCPHDSGGAAYFGTFSWDALVPPATLLRFQLRCAGTEDALMHKEFSGPDGTTNSFYAVNNQPINPVNNGTRWFQYRAYFNRNDTTVTPLLRGVTVNYNLLQELKLVSPTGGENWTGLQNIAWTASDKDNDALSFDIFLENATATIPLAQNLSDAERTFPFNASLVPNGTYRIRMFARDDNPSIPLTVTAASGNFTIHHPQPPNPPNHPPHVWLVWPLNNSVVNTTSVRLAWVGTDPDNDPLTYTVHRSDLPFPNGNIVRNMTTSQYLELANLADNTTYYWTVDAGDGIDNHTDVPAEVWSFTVHLPSINHPPRITSTPPITATVGVEYIYNVTATDPDNDALTFSLGSPVEGMTIDPASGRLSWTPSSVQTLDIMVTASDGRGGIDRQTFTVKVREKPAPTPERPRCTITSPANGSKIHGLVPVRGTAIRGASALTSVLVRIDGGNWQTATGLENWSLKIGTGGLTIGEHTIEARAFDGSLYSDTASVKVTVVNPEPSVTSGGDPWCLPAIIITVVAGLGILLLLRKKKRGPE